MSSCCARYRKSDVVPPLDTPAMIRFGSSSGPAPGATMLSPPSASERGPVRRDRSYHPADDHGCTMTPTRTRVLSIVGPGRSGTTILGNILGEVEGVTNAGELRWLWRRGLAERRPCGCGLPPAECPRWSVVLDDMRRRRLPAAGDDAVAAAVDTVARTQREILARRNRLRAISAAAGRDTAWEALLC